MAIFSTIGGLIGSKKAGKGAAFAKEVYGDAKKNLAPWIDTGQDMSGQMGDVLTPGGATADLAPHQQMGMDRITQEVNPFDPNLIGQNFQSSPGYQFMVDQGQAAIDAGAAAKGGLLSGATQKAAMQHRVGLANQDYWNFVNQTQQGMGMDAAQRQQQFSNIFGVSGQGLQAAGTLAQAGSSAAGTAAQSYGQQGQQIGGAFGAIGKFLNPFGG